MIPCNDFNTIMDLLDRFSDEHSCIIHLEKIRWPDKVVSPFDKESTVYKRDNGYHCRNTNKQFNVKTNTLFHGSKISLRKWFLAIFIVTSHKKGISSIQLAKDIGVTQKTSWFMLQRIRKCFVIEYNQLNGTVEADETFVGGKNKNRHADKKVKNSQGRSFKDKTPILGLMERGEKKQEGLNKAGNPKMIVIKPSRVLLSVVPSTSKESLQPHIVTHVKKGTTLYTDEWHGYNGSENRYNHHFIDHSKKIYVDRDQPEIHTNTIEGFWAIYKRCINGTWHNISKKHMQLYCNEVSFRYNTINMSTDSRIDCLLSNMENRLTYKMAIL